MEWKEVKMTEFCYSVADGTHDSPKRSENGRYLITSKHIKGSSIDFDNAYYISEEDYHKIIKRSKVDKWDVIISMIGAYCGFCYLEESDYTDYAVKNVGLLKVGKEIESKWLYYYLTSPEGKNKLQSLRAGSTQPYISLGALRDFYLRVPTRYDCMKNVVSLLSSLDAKIENNNKINANLEAQAAALFKSWFVDFEPFRDGEFVESELGMIPKGWIIDQIANIPHIIETGRRPKGGAIETGIPSVGAEHIKGMGTYDFSKTKYIGEDFASKLKTGKINGYELLIYKDGGKPGYFIPNYSIFGEGYPFEECYLNEHVFKLDFNGNRGFNIFCYFFFQTDIVMSYLNAQGGKAAIPGINRNDVESITIFSPENMYVHKFGEKMIPLFKKILKNCVENQRLSSLRDTLLPKLMSGEIDLDNIIL